MLNLTAEDFAEILGTTEEVILLNCKEVIDSSDFSYKIVTQKERESIFLRVLKTLSSGLKVSGPHRYEDWEVGWSENLADYKKDKSDLSKLLPKFIRPSEVIRLKGDYIVPTDPGFETSFVSVLRNYLFSKYFTGVTSIYEFGCGTGLNLVSIAKLLPGKKLYGLDWSKASCDIVDELASSLNLDLHSKQFDMFHPLEEINLDSSCAVLTVGAMEQLGTDYNEFTRFLLRRKPAVCINVETLYELHNRDYLFDYVSAEYLVKRNYLRGYLSLLRELESIGTIDILEVRRVFGGIYTDGYSYVVWKPRNRNV